jgi:hypothetical protein
MPRQRAPLVDMGRACPAPTTRASRQVSATAFKSPIAGADTGGVLSSVAVEALIAPFVILLVLAFVALPTAWLAHRRGRSWVIWGGLGMVLPVIGILFVLGLDEDEGLRMRGQS